ncbi:phage tail protein [Cronobacter turicensis]
MSQTVITLAFEQWKARQGVTGEAVLLDEFVFANVPGLNPDLPVSRSEQLPPAAQIVHRQAVSRKGVVNENAVVHSVVLGADVGDFSFNWIGLMNKASGTLAMIVHAPEQQKLKTKLGQQGNVLTRSFLLEFDGAQAETAINTPAETWQIDFTARLAGMDERQRLENIDVFGTAAFMGDGWLVGKTGTQYFVTPGTGYVQGLRAHLAASQNITVTTKPVKVWLDVSWEGSLVSTWQVKSKVTVAATLADYVQNGVQHYVFALASIDANGVITDLRPQGSQAGRDASDAIKKHEQSRNHPDATLNAKGFTQLSSALDSEAEDKAATPKAVKAANDNASGRVPSGRTVNGHALSEDINITAQDTGALPAGGTAVAANRLATARNIGGVAFDGTANINLPGVNMQGNQNTTGNAATATRLQTARTINGVAFDGSENITLYAGALDAYTKAESEARFSPLVGTYTSIGSYIMARSSTGNTGPGVNVAGASLRASTADGSIAGGGLPGTWRCMGYMTTTNDAHRTTLWMRIS